MVDVAVSALEVVLHLSAFENNIKKVIFLLKKTSFFLHKILGICTLKKR